MASEASTSDVIELVSSDEETEPAPKKIKPGRNAMVHIPRGVTIKPTNQKKPLMPIIKDVVGRGITLTKLDKLVDKPYVNKTKPNGRPIQIRNPPVIAKPLLNPALQHGVNPLNLIRKFNNPQIMINKVPSNKNILKHPIRVGQKSSPKSVNSLPPSITVTRTTGGVKRPAIANVSVQNKKLKINPKATVKRINPAEILTVELDDDEVAQPSTANPQWYLRPEQQSETTNLEEKNNAEPEPTNFIEITIDDSPLKPALNKRTCEIGTELAITIDDSPVKTVIKQVAASDGSDNESSTRKEVPNSKKKLEYPKDNSVAMEANTIEIEIEPMEVTSCNKENDKANDHIASTVMETVEIEESPLKVADVPQATTPKKVDKVQNQVKSINIEEAAQTVEEGGEFHPIYQNFIDLCFKLENSDDMKKIVEKKIKAYYKQVPREYTESENFIDMVSSKIISMKAGPEKMYLYIKDIVDELNLQRKMAKSQVPNKETKSTEPEPFLYGEDSEFDSKRQRQIRKLEKTLKKLHRAIQKLEEQEVDFDDEEDSVYLLTESDDGSSSLMDIDKTPEEKRKVLLQRYKERMVRVHAKFCQLTNTKMPSEPRVQLDARPGQPKGPAKRLEKWINRKVPIGKPLPFPDFHDVIRCVREANDEDKLRWNEADIMEEARDLFTRCGKKLQRRRQENEWRLAASRILQDIDPAEDNEGLKKKLEENKLLATKKETEVFNKYADRQSQLKLEAVEIGDKEAEESPLESEDEEPNEESATLENKEKRKKRLRRLIQERSKKTGEKEAKAEDSEENQSERKVISKEDNETESNDTQSKKQQSESPEKDIGMEVDSVNVDKNDNEPQPKTIEKVHSISDDSTQVDSDVDELHLLQKLHSENDVNTSTLDSSDSDTPADISDTLHSSSDNKGKAMNADGVISIENSSYSESEVTKDTSNSKGDDEDCVENVEPETEPAVKPSTGVDLEIEFESLNNVEMKTAQTNNDEYLDSVGNILLASSDDEDESPRIGNACINLKDDAISIGDTEIQEADLKKDKTVIEKNDVPDVQNKSAQVVDISVNLKDNAEAIGDTEIGNYELKNDTMDTDNNDSSSVVNTKSTDDTNFVGKAIGDTEIGNDELKNDTMDTDNNDSSSVVNTKSTDDTNFVGIDSTKDVDTFITSVDTSIKSDEQLLEAGNGSHDKVQTSLSSEIKETEETTTGNDKTVIGKIEEANSIVNKKSIDAITSESSKSATGDESNLVMKQIDRVTENINLDDSKKPLETVQNDSVDSVTDTALTNDNVFASSDNIDDFLLADNSTGVDQSDSLEKVLEDLQSNLQSNEPTPAIESVKNAA